MTTARPERSRLPLAAALLTVLLWASAFVAIRHLGPRLSPGPLALGRLVVGSVVLGAVTATRRWVPPTRSQWARVVVCGLLWFGGYNVALNAAERRVDAGTASMLVNIGPILIAVLAGALLGEGFPRRLLGGSLVAFAGVVLIGTAVSSGGADVVGVLLCLGAAVGYAVAVVLQKPLLATLPALQVTAMACAVGTAACLPFAAQLGRELTRLPAADVGWVAFLGAFPTAVAFTTWAYALARTSAGRLGATTYLVPPVAIALGAALLGEVPPALAVAGGVLCLGGVALSRRRPRQVVMAAPSKS